VLLGIGLGGFMDGILLHQILQWHHMLTSAGYPSNSVENLKFNTFWDGVFHASTYLFVVASLVVLWRHARRLHFAWSTKLIVGTLLMGFGIFNLVEGAIDHQLLGLHHVRDDLGGPLGWDLGFLALGAALVAVGLVLVRVARPDELDLRHDAVGRRVQ
jgi:uncharacterized membrane protein